MIILHILQNKYLCIYEDSFGAKILWDDCVLLINYVSAPNTIERFTNKCTHNSLTMVYMWHYLGGTME